MIQDLVVRKDDTKGLWAHGSYCEDGISQHPWDQKLGKK